MEVAERLLEQMSVPDADQVRLPMSWHDYLELPERPRAEWVDGTVVVNSPPVPEHGFAAVRLGSLLTRALPDLVVLSEVSLRLPDNRVRIPDLMVLEGWPSTTIADEPVALVIEVLSRSTRAEDLGLKSEEYADAGVGQLWLVDPAQRTLEVRDNVDGAWQVVLRLDDAHSTGSVTIGEHGSIDLDLASILR